MKIENWKISEIKDALQFAKNALLDLTALDSSEEIERKSKANETATTRMIDKALEHLEDTDEAKTHKGYICMCPICNKLLGDSGIISNGVYPTRESAEANLSEGYIVVEVEWNENDSGKRNLTWSSSPEYSASETYWKSRGI